MVSIEWQWYNTSIGNYWKSPEPSSIVNGQSTHRMVYEDYDSPYEDLLAKCYMSTQECQRSRTLATEVYKAVNVMTPNYTQELFQVKGIP